MTEELDRESLWTRLRAAHRECINPQIYLEFHFPLNYSDSTDDLKPYVQSLLGNDFVLTYASINEDECMCIVRGKNGTEAVTYMQSIHNMIRQFAYSNLKFKKIPINVTVSREDINLLINYENYFLQQYKRKIIHKWSPLSIEEQTYINGFGDPNLIIKELNLTIVYL